MRTVAGFRYCTSFPIPCGSPSMKSPQLLNPVVGEPPLNEVSPPVKLNPPRGPFDACGWKWLMSYLLYSKPNRSECDPLITARFAVATYCGSRNWNGFDTFGFPMLEKVLNVNRGYPLCRKSGPFVPGIFSTSSP